MNALIALLLALVSGDPLPGGNPPAAPGESGESTAEAPRDGRAVVDTPRFLTNRKGGLELPLPDEKDSFFFAVYGDRTGGPDEGVEILAEAVAETNLLGPDLVMTVGDLIQGYNGPKPWLREMEEFRGIMNRLHVPWFPVAGNHDIYYRGPRGVAVPAEEHEGRYEMHFGPLWYAFRHKSAWFIVLYTDEGNPETGERNFNKPDCQRMSPEQLAWLDETLKVTKEAEHCFVFCHHPRWIGGNYGSDWDKVHERLVAAGNVKGVFGGHIHRMRYDPKDGIEYFALATVGGHQNGTVPDAGYLHCFDLVTVRPDRIERATLPVGATMDPREITGEVSTETPKLAAVRPHWLGEIVLGEDGAVDQSLEFTLTNPTTRAVDAEVHFRSGDPRWSFVPDHVHGQLTPSGSQRFSVQVRRAADTLDGGLQLPTIELGFDYLTDTTRFRIPRQDQPMPFDLSRIPLPEVPGSERVLRLDGGDAHASVASKSIDLPDGPFTLEAWVKADRFKGRQGLVCKTEGSEYGLYANDGELAFALHLDGAYVEPKSGATRMQPGQWHHVAGVFDGQELRVYLDGKIVGREEGEGARTPNDLPLVVGGDVRRDGSATSTLDGDIDEVRLSVGARYTGEAFTPSRRHAQDDATLLLLSMDGALGPYLRTTGKAETTLTGGAALADL